MTPAVLALLAVTSLPPTVKPGGVEKLIDSLVELRGIRDFWPHFDKPVAELIELGFDVIPALIDHLDDERQTGTYLTIRSSILSNPLRVKHFVRDILDVYIDDQQGWFDQLSGDELKKKVREQWWAEAKKLGEEQYIVQNITCWRGDGRDIRFQLLRVLEMKYPERLPDAFANALKAGKGELYYSPLVDAVAKSKLPAATKKKLFLDLYALKSWEGKAVALNGLHTVDPDEFHKLLIATLGELPKHPKGPDGEEWPFRGFRSFADTASLTGDAKVWASVRKYLGRASVEVRWEWIGELSSGGEDSQPSRKQRIEFVLAEFSDDSVRKVPGREPDVDDELRNWAAKRLGYMLDVETEPTSSPGPTQIGRSSATRWRKRRRRRPSYELRS